MNGWVKMDFVKLLASQDFATFSGIITIVAAIISIAVIIVSNSIGKRSLYAKTVSENRVQWLYKIRRMVYNFLKSSRVKEIGDDTLTNIKNQIQLYYNKDEQNELISLLDKIIADREDENLKEELIKHCQIVFKSEWEKVKKEAGELAIKRVLKWVLGKRESIWYKRPWIWVCIIVVLAIALLWWRFNEPLIQCITSRISLEHGSKSSPTTPITENSPIDSKSNINTIKDIVLPIALSVVSAVIFWFAFNLFPEKRRYNKIRPKVDYNMYSIYSNLFHYFDLALTHNKNSPSMFQHEIRGGILKKETIILGLQNKSLINYPKSGEIPFNYIIIGHSLDDIASRIDIEINRLFSFNTYLKADEILLLEKIRTKLFTYDYKGNGLIIPVDRSLSYMSENIFDIYELFLQLQKIIFSSKFSSEFERNIYLYLIQYYYYSKKYELCKKAIKTNKEKYPGDMDISISYNFLCDYMLNRKDEVYKKIESLFSKHIDLVTYRSFVAPIIKEDRVQELLKKYYSESQINTLANTINHEELQKTMFLKQAQDMKASCEK